MPNDKRKPRRVRVARNVPNTVNDYTVPIILVPGIMGSRLQWQKTYKGVQKDFYWDPDNSSLNPRNEGRIVKWATQSADEMRPIFRCLAVNDLSTQTVMKENANLEGGKQLSQDEIRRGWGGTANSHYGEFLRSGRDKFYSQTFNPVYAFGYDWRNSNYNSGKRLAARVQEILDFHKAKKCIIVTHSMGGLVTRSAMRFVPQINSKILTVIHTCQPVLGAPVAYRRFFTGVRASATGLTSTIDGNNVESVVFSYIVGSTAEGFIKLMTVLDGATQLLPAEGYPNVKNLPWLRFVSLAQKKAGEVGYWNRSIYENYVDVNQPPGSIINDSAQEWRIIKQEFVARLKHSKAFHNALRVDGNLFKHPYTFSLYSRGLTTDRMVEFEQVYENWYDPARLNPKKFWVGDNGYALALTDWQRPKDGGDATVPEESAVALFPDQVNIAPPKDWKKVASNGDGKDNKIRQYAFNGIEHAAALSDAEMSKVTSFIVHRILIAFGKLPK